MMRIPTLLVLVLTNPIRVASADGACCRIVKSLKNTLSIDRWRQCRASFFFRSLDKVFLSPCHYERDVGNGRVELQLEGRDEQMGRGKINEKGEVKR